LQAAINDANAGNTIRVHGTFVGIFTIGQSLTLKGDDTAVLDGNQLGTVVTTGTSDSSVITLINLTIINGNAYNGGGIYNNAAILTLKNLRVIQNTATNFGGGIYNDGFLTIYHSSISDNTATVDGGGLINFSGTGLTIIGSEFNGNSAGGNGAGINTQSGVSTPSIIAETKISNNSTPSGNGGGVYADDHILSLYDVFISYNEALYGGGVYATGNTTNIESSSVHENYAYAQGGGGYIDFGLLNIVLSEVTHNAAEDDGGGILLTSPSSEYLQLAVSEVEHNSPNNIGFD
jgi:predicted outer membrane repeat protein